MPLLWSGVKGSDVLIFITGDTHGDFTRFNSSNFPEQKQMTKDDYVIISGDFGIWQDTPREQYWLAWLNAKPFTTLFVDGNHSNFDRLYQMPVSEWHDGQVHFVRDNVIHLMRGQVFEIAEKRFFTMGGAASHDISDGILEPGDPNFTHKRQALDRQRALYRVNHVSWWKEEMPNEKEYETARRNLDACDWQVDYIITHCCPSSIVDIISGGLYQPDPLTDFFEEVRNRCDFDYWFFGHYHDNRIIERKYIMLYEQIVEIV